MKSKWTILVFFMEFCSIYFELFIRLHYLQKKKKKKNALVIFNQNIFSIFSLMTFTGAGGGTTCHLHEIQQFDQIIYQWTK